MKYLLPLTIFAQTTYAQDASYYSPLESRNAPLTGKRLRSFEDPLKEDAAAAKHPRINPPSTEAPHEASPSEQTPARTMTHEYANHILNVLVGENRMLFEQNRWIVHAKTSENLTDIVKAINLMFGEEALRRTEFGLFSSDFSSAE